MSVIYYDEPCPNCHRAVWWRDDNPDDITKPDVEALACPWCEHTFLIPGCEDWTTLEDAYVRQGRKSMQDFP